MSKVKLMAATLAMMAFAAVPAYAGESDVTAEGGDAINITGDAMSGDATNNADIEQDIEQDQQVNQNQQVSGGSGNQSNTNVSQYNAQNANQDANIEQFAMSGDANTGGNLAVGGDASIGEDEDSGFFFDFFGFFSRIFG